MSSRIALQWSGWAGFACAIMLPVAWVLTYFAGSGAETLADAMAFAAEIMLLFVLMGIYGSQIEETGAYGFLGFLLAIVATGTALSLSWAPESGEPGAAPVALLPIMAACGLAGYLLLGIGTWRANRFPRWVAVALPLGWAIGLVSAGLVGADVEIGQYFHILGFVVWSAGIMMASQRLMSAQVEAAPRLRFG